MKKNKIYMLLDIVLLRHFNFFFASKLFSQIVASLSQTHFLRHYPNLPIFTPTTTTSCA